MKGLTCWVQGMDCTNSGVTSGRECVTLIGDGIPEIFEASDDHPAVILEYDLNPKGGQAGQLSVAKPDWLAKIDAGKPTSTNAYECLAEDWTDKHRIVNVVARPIDGDGKPRRGGMMGGNYISTSDSRFPVTCPIPVHDRFE